MVGESGGRGMSPVESRWVVLARLIEQISILQRSCVDACCMWSKKSEYRYIRVRSMQ